MFPAVDPMFPAELRLLRPLLGLDFESTLRFDRLILILLQNKKNLINFTKILYKFILKVLN